MSKAFNKIIAIIIVFVVLGLGFSDTGLNDFLENTTSNDNEFSLTKPRDDTPIFGYKKSEQQNKKEKYQERETATLKRVIDGDTIIVEMEDGTEERVRLLLIDTPESVHPTGTIEKFGPESSDYAKQYLKQGKKIKLEIGENPRDRYDRLLAHVFVDGINFGLHMVEKGYARVAYVYEPNTKYLEEFRKAEEKAKKQKNNIWSIDGYVTEKGFDMSVVND